MFSNMVVKMLSDLQIDLFGPEVAAETFRMTEIEPEPVPDEKSVNGNSEKIESVVEEKSPKKKRSKMLDLLRRKRRKPKGRRRTFENGRTDPESDGGKSGAVTIGTMTLS
jgi:hypothetical protein